VSLSNARTAGQLAEQFEQIRKQIRELEDQVHEFAKSNSALNGAAASAKEIRRFVTSLDNVLGDAERFATLASGAFSEYPASMPWYRA
jgi:methyl-accepting chemotaxis protein